MDTEGGARGDTLQAQSSALCKECHVLLSYLQSNVVGEQPEKTAEGQPSLANPMDESISLIQEARKAVEETRALLADAVINKLR